MHKPPKMMAPSSRGHLLNFFDVSVTLILLALSGTCDGFGILRQHTAPQTRPTLINPPTTTRLSAHPTHGPESRRDFTNGLLASAVTSFSILLNPTSASSEEEQIEVYFGCGCFWHVQHEFATAEKRILGRSDSQLTARTGYAGGKAGTRDGRVCYHNSKRVSDYGELGHAEVVRLRIPPSSFPEFATEYVKLFDKNGFRADQAGDKGLEYRNLVGFPGGAEEAGSKYLQQLIEGSKADGDKLAFAKGSGDDPDRRALVFVMDTAEFPFFVSEQYHQFHDGFKMGENYPDSYNAIAERMAKEGTLGASTCPKGMI